MKNLAKMLAKKLDQTIQRYSSFFEVKRTLPLPTFVANFYITLSKIGKNCVSIRKMEQ